jgi:hypothetical protein
MVASYSRALPVIASAFFAVTAAVPASAQRDAIPASCRAEVDAKLPGWRLARPPAELAILAEKRKLVTNIASADFDLDGSADTALLVVAPRRGHPTSHLAICLNRADGVQVHVIREPYCQDSISFRPKGTVDYDDQTKKNVRYWTNAVQTSCHEAAGGSYLYKDGKFVLIVDSD